MGMKIISCKIERTFEEKLVYLLYEPGTLTITWKGIKKPIVLTKTIDGCLECDSHSLTHNGYPKITFNNKTRRLNRFLYSLVNDKNYDDLGDLFLCHECDNRLCVNPDHLKLDTHEYNMIDMCNKERQARGEKVANSKLTESEVIEIRQSDLTQKELAEIYKVHPKTIANIMRGETWVHIKTS